MNADIVRGIRVHIHNGSRYMVSGIVESVIPAYGVRIMRDDTNVSDWFAFDVPGRTFTI